MTNVVDILELENFIFREGDLVNESIKCDCKFVRVGIGGKKGVGPNKARTKPEEKALLTGTFWG